MKNESGDMGPWFFKIVLKVVRIVALVTQRVSETVFQRTEESLRKLEGKRKRRVG